MRSLRTISLTTVKFSYQYIFELVWHKMFRTLLGYAVARVCASPSNSTSVHLTVFPYESVGSGDETIVPCGQP